MNQHFLTPSAVQELTQSYSQSLGLFAPELILCVGIILMLLIRLFNAFNRVNLGYVALVVTLVSLWVSWTAWQPFLSSTPINARENLFAGMLVYDGLSAFLRLFLLLAAALLIWLTLLTGIPDKEDSADFYTLFLGGTLGMILMGSSNHLLMVFIAVEMASLPSYGLAGFLKGRRQSSEAALKYVVYGGAAAGVMLFGISLLVGRFGTGYLPEVAASYLALAQKGGFDPLLMIGTLLIFVGLAFKLSAVPFHFWCPDVFEGASAEVGAFLSVSSKAAAVALTGRLVLNLTGSSLDALGSFEQWKQASIYFGPVLVLLAAVTVTFGNLAAYTQTNLKRLLAYSTIAHAGIVLAGLATLTAEGLSAGLLYMTFYLFMNVGAFAVVAFLRNQIGSEDVAAYPGMIRRAPLQTICLAVFFLSLVGLPPFIGYVAKFEVFAAIYNAAQAQSNKGLLVLLAIALLNTVFSLFYYVRVLKIMIIDSPAPGAESQPLSLPRLQNVFSLLLAIIVVAGVLIWDPLSQFGTQRSVMPFRGALPSIEASK